MSRLRPLRIALVAAVAVALGLLAQRWIRRASFGPTAPPNLAEGRASSDLAPERRPVTVASGLDVPWEIRFLPDGDLLVSERRGRLVRLAPDGSRREVSEVPGVVERGEGGLMGLALHPDFGARRWIYVCFTTDTGGRLTNRVERYRYAGGLRDRTPVLAGIPGSRFHDGCRLEFGPDNFLYVSTGDATRPELAQDLDSPSGKILRLTEDGGPAPGNPFGSVVFSYGHRNPQGLAFDDGGLWATEHGRSGDESGMDEVNRIRAGGNYGWPLIEGDEEREAMIPPRASSGPDVTWAPSGAAWVAGRLYFAGLRGQALYEARPGGGGGGAEPPGAMTIVPHFFGEYGRLRAVRLGPDGMLYFATSNRDGRGDPGPDDDRILRVDPAALGS